MSRLEHENVLQQLADANKLLEMQQIDIDASRLELAATQERARTAEAEAVDLEANAAEKMANFAELAAQRCSGLATGTEKLEHDLAEAKEQLAEANELVKRHKHDASAIRFQLAITQRRAEHGAAKLLEAQVSAMDGLTAMHARAHGRQADCSRQADWQTGRLWQVG